MRWSALPGQLSKAEMNARKAPRGAFRAFGDAKQVMEDVAEALTGYALPVTLKDRQ
jgi:hypothetical protein